MKAKLSVNGSTKKSKKNGAINIAKPKKSAQVEKDLAKTYNEFKEFEGQKYTGMKIGRSHKWYYDKGEWKETKLTPDLWRINYAVKKRRAGKAPKGSGVPVGTEYHWYILAHQNVRKLNANIYTTAMSGLKYKLAHKRADSEKWSASDKAQRRRLVKMLLDLAAEIEMQPVPTKEITKNHTSKNSGVNHKAKKVKARIHRT